MPFDLASSATANNSRTFFAKSLRADASEARRVLVCCAWSEAISDMSSVLRFIVAACPTLNCQKIRPREKTMPHPATIQAFVFEFKIKLLPFRLRTLMVRRHPWLLLARRVSVPLRCTLEACVPVMAAEPIPVALRLSMMDEQTPQGNHPRPFAALHQSNARPSALARPEFLEYLQPALRRDEFLAHVSPKTLKAANRPRLLPAIRCVIRRGTASPRGLSVPRPLQPRQGRDPALRTKISPFHQFHVSRCRCDRSSLCDEFLDSRIRIRSEEHTSELQSHSDLHSFPTRCSSDLGCFQQFDA